MQKRDFLLLKNSSSFSGGVKGDFDEQLGMQGGLQTANRVQNLSNVQKPGKARRQVQSHFEFSTANNVEAQAKYLDEGYLITAPSLVEINRVSGMEKQAELKKQPEYAAGGVDVLLHQTANREQTRPKPNPSNSNLRRQKSSNYSTKNSHAPQELPLSSSSSLSPQQRFFFDPNAQAQAGRRLPKKNHKTLCYFSNSTHNTKPDTPLMPSSHLDTKKPSPLKKLTSAAESNLPQRKIQTEDGKSSPILENICSSPQQTSWACLPRSLNTTNTQLFVECNKQVSHKTSLLFPAKYPQQQQPSSSTSSAFSNSNPIYNNFTISPQKFSPQNNSNLNSKANENNNNNYSYSNAPNSMYYSHPKSYLQSNISSSKEEGSTMCLSIGLKSDVASSNSSGRNFPLSVDSPGHLLATEPLKRKVSPSRFKESQKLAGGGGGSNAVNSNNIRSCGIPFRQSWSSSKKQQSQIYNNSTSILQKDHTNTASNNSQNTLNNETNNQKSIIAAANNSISANNNNFNLQNTLNKNDSSLNQSARNPILNQSIPIQSAVSSQSNCKQPVAALPVGGYPTAQPKQTHFELSKLFPLTGQQQQYLQPFEPCQQPQQQQQQIPVGQYQHQIKDNSIRQEQYPNLLLEHIDSSEIKRNTTNFQNHPANSNNYSFSATTPLDSNQPKSQQQHQQQSRQLVITLDCQASSTAQQKFISKSQCSQPQSFSQSQQQSNNLHSFFPVKLSSPNNTLISSFSAEQTPQLLVNSTSNSLTTISSSKLPSHPSAINRESSKQSCKIIQEKSVNRVNITLKNSNSKKLSSSTSSITEDNTLDIRSAKGATSSRDSIHNYSSSNPTSPKIPKQYSVAASDQQQDYPKQQGQQHFVLDGLTNSQVGLKSDSKMNNINNSSASLLQMRKSLLFAKNASSTQTADKSNGNSGKDNETDTAHAFFGNMIQVSQNKHIDLDDPMVQKEVSSIVRNLLKIKNDYKSPSSSSNSNNSSGKLKLKQQQQQTQAKQQQLQQKQSTPHSSSSAGLKRQNSAGNQGNYSKLYSEIVNKFDVQHYKTVSGSSTHFEAIPEIGGGSSSSFVESQQTPEDSIISANGQQRQQVQQGFNKKVQNSQGKD